MSLRNRNFKVQLAIACIGASLCSCGLAGRFSGGDRSGRTPSYDDLVASRNASGAEVTAPASEGSISAASSASSVAPGHEPSTLSQSNRRESPPAEITRTDRPVAVGSALEAVAADEQQKARAAASAVEAQKQQIEQRRREIADLQRQKEASQAEHRRAERAARRAERERARIAAEADALNAALERLRERDRKAAERLRGGGEAPPSEEPHARSAEPRAASEEAAAATAKPRQHRRHPRHRLRRHHTRDGKEVASAEAEPASEPPSPPPPRAGIEQPTEPVAVPPAEVASREKLSSPAPSGRVKVVGAVDNPGMYRLDKARTVSQALALAGKHGSADVSAVRVIRGGQAEAGAGQAPRDEFVVNAGAIDKGQVEDVELRPGDLVIVPAAP